MVEIKRYDEKIFEEIKHVDKNGNEYWVARELMPLLEYSKWENFHKVIKKAMIACRVSNNSVNDCFPEVRKSIISGKGKENFIIDYHLSRYACYLIVQNADSKKEPVSLGQTYFAIQTRKQELTEDYFKSLDEDKKRLEVCGQTIDKNMLLYETAKNVGVENYGRFTNYGYKGLYGGETAKDISRRKGLKDSDEILDYMGSEELVDNLFRIVQTDAKLKKDNVFTEVVANDIHYEVGKAVRDTIDKLGGTMPENLPTPNKSIHQLENEELNKINL